MQIVLEESNLERESNFKKMILMSFSGLANRRGPVSELQAFNDLTVLAAVSSESS